MKNKLTEFIILSGTVLALAAINYSIIHTPFIFIVLLIMLVHEFGHYFAAKFQNGDPQLPYFIPIPFVPIGITRVRRMKFLSFKSKKNIVLFGPILASFTSFILYLFSLSFYPHYSLSLLLLTIGELLFNFIGFDGKKYRHYSKQEKVSCI
jgi:hypothetical protein